MTPEKLEEVKKLCLAKPLLKEFFEHYAAIVSSPYYEGYTTVKSQVMTWQKDIQEKKITISGDEKDKKFERAHKFFSELKPYYDLLDFFRSKMTPEEVRSADEKATTLFEAALEDSNR